MKTALTLGFFDGVHLGHRKLLQKLREYPHTTILTFSNHPQSLFRPPGPPLIFSLEQKLALLRAYADELLVVPFTLEFANIRYDELLSQFDLSHLILGIGAAFGKNREGVESAVRSHAEKQGFAVEYIPKLLMGEEPVSSSRIRRALAAGDTTLAHQLLGTP